MLEHRGHGFAARRQLVDDGHVEVAIYSHRQRARDGRCGHHQHMGRRHTVLAPQAGTLSHAEAVLFVNDGQSQVVELHGVLDEGMGAD